MARCAVGSAQLIFGLLWLLGAVATAIAEDLPGVDFPPVLKHKLHAALEARGGGDQPRTRYIHDGVPVYTNRLIQEDSPYLLQHAHNPVNWFPWGPEAFKKARAENKPVFLSIGYSTCHWCHVMERESFDDVEVARYLNEHFVAIKVDRERRPDIDRLYMTALQVMGRSGGWPMSSFLTPDGDSFFGATYLPRKDFLSLMQQVNQAWRENRPGLVSQAGGVADAVRRMQASRKAVARVGDDVNRRAIAALMSSHDAQYGGFGYAQKFPGSTRYLFLLDQAVRNDDPDLIELLRFDLDAMARGGIHDQIGGGFHRYSTDRQWRVPHFERMLYTQALLARVYLRAAQLTGQREFARTAHQIMEHVLQDMRSDDGGFRSATDADSDGGEGRFFLWTPAQLRAVLPKADAQFAIDAWGVTEKGNFDGANVLYLPVTVESLARKRSISADAAFARLDRIRATLYRAREARPHPARDDKIVTAWNGMMIVALAEAAIAFDEPRYAAAALKAGERLWHMARRADGHLWRVSLDGRSSVAARQGDYAWFADACVQLYDLTNNPRWLERAGQLVDTMDALFRDRKSGGYFMSTATDGPQAMTRPKDDYDDATPSGNAVALHVLARLAARTADYRPAERARALLGAFAGDIDENPAIYGYMLTGRELLNHGDTGPYQYAARGAVRVSGSLNGDTIVIELTMRPGWHVNAHRVLQDDLVPTVVEPGGDVPGWTFQAPQYPEPVIRKLGFSNDELALYEKNVLIRLPVQRSGHGLLAPLASVSVELQACDDSRCLPPERLVLKIPVSSPFDHG